MSLFTLFFLCYVVAPLLFFNVSLFKEQDQKRFHIGGFMFHLLLTQVISVCFGMMASFWVRPVPWVREDWITASAWLLATVPAILLGFMVGTNYCSFLRYEYRKFKDNDWVENKAYRPSYCARAMVVFLLVSLISSLFAFTKYGFNYRA